MDDYYAYLSHERSHSPSLLDVLVETDMSGKLDSAHTMSERLVQVELHPVSAAATDVFALQYDRKIGQDDQQTESASSEDGYNIMDEEASSDVHSSCDSPVPSESASAASDWISAGTTAGSTPLPLSQSPQDARSIIMMNDGHFDVTSGYASNNSSKDEPHSIDNCSSAASLRSVSPDSLSSLGILPTTHGATTKPADLSSVGQAAVVTPFPPSRLSEETPIERDIRLAALRENELRLQQGIGNVKLSDEKDRILTPKKMVKSHLVNMEQQINYSNTQRILATTRLQQEIDEQKRREMDLKRDGRVQSISEDRMDNDSAFDDEESVVTQLSTSSSGTIDPALQKATIKDQRAFFEKASGRLSSSTDDVHTPPPLGHTIKLQDKISVSKKTPPTPIQSKLPNFPTSNMKMPVSMERFISSRGKMTMNGMTGSMTSPPVQNHFSNGTNHDSYVDFSAVRLHKVDDANLPAPTIKVYLSAKTKISQELREMEEREAELRRTRLSLGLSDDSGTSDNSPSTKDAPTEESRRSNSVGLTPSAGQDLMDASQIPKGRQSLLLAQWEARSQQ